MTLHCLENLSFYTAGGVNYIRWGRTTCPDTEGTELLHTGMAAGAKSNKNGGGSKYLCLPDHPEFLNVTLGFQRRRSEVYGADYESHNTPPAFRDLLHFNVPCVACYTSARGAKIMIPGKVNCPSSWTREYYGYLMSENNSHRGRMAYECMDLNAESFPGSVAADIGGAEFYFTEISCVGSLCPPYREGFELPCVVCTK